jgi:stringent starvation protein B
MSSNQPYLIRAIHEWILDNEMTPHILVNAELPNVDVPRQSVQNGQIVLNLTPHAISAFQMNNEAVSFSARFSGKAQSLYIPIHAIRAIYAQENGQGMAFPEMEESSQPTDQLVVIDKKNVPETSDDNDEPPPKNPPFLKVVK